MANTADFFVTIFCIFFSAKSSTAFSPLSLSKVTHRNGVSPVWGKTAKTSLPFSTQISLIGKDVASGKNRRRNVCAYGLQASVSSDVEASGLKIIIAGAPASGKGTQCELIKNNFGVIHLSTGDMLREAVSAKTEVGIKAKDYMDSGKLVPDEVIIGIVKDRLAEKDCVTQGWLLDGFPRTRAQADALAEEGIEADCFLFLNVPDEILVERVVGRRTDPVTGKIYHMKFSPPEDKEVIERLEHRSDDTEEKVVVRLEQFHANVDAVKGCYKDISIEIDGSAQPSEVASKIAEALDQRKSKVEV